MYNKHLHCALLIMTQDTATVDNIHAFETQWQSFVQQCETMGHMEQLSNYNTLRNRFEKAHEMWTRNYEAWCKTCETQPSTSPHIGIHSTISVDQLVKKHQQLQHEMEMALEKNMQTDKLMELWEAYTNTHTSLVHALTFPKSSEQ